MTDKIKQFIRDRLKMIDENEWDKFYSEASMHDAFQWLRSIGEMTEFLYECECDPLRYLTYIPVGFMAESNRSFVQLPETIKHIDTGAFRSMPNLEKITIPESCRSIGSDVFFNCASLKQVTILNEYIFLGDDIFNACPKLTEINFRGTIDSWVTAQYCDSSLTIRCSDGNIIMDDAGKVHHV